MTFGDASRYNLQRRKKKKRKRKTNACRRCAAGSVPSFSEKLVFRPGESSHSQVFGFFVRKREHSDYLDFASVRASSRHRAITFLTWSMGRKEEAEGRGGERSSQVFSTQRARARARPNKEILDKSRQSLCCPMVVPALFSRASVRFKRCLAFRFRLVAFVRFQSLTIRVIMPTQQQHENEETFTIPLPRLRRSPRSAN